MPKHDAHVTAWRRGPWWWSRLAEWRLRPYSGLPFVREGMILAAEDFIARYADQATAHGWQPAHLLHPRGLAAEWAQLGPPERIAWESRAMLYQTGGALWMGRSAQPDGSTPPMRGEALTALMGRQLAFVSVA